MPVKSMPRLTARLGKSEERPEILAPSVGQWRDVPEMGTLVRPGMSIGVIETLGVRHALVAPAGAHGVVVERADPSRAQVAVGYGDRLLVLDPEVAGLAVEAEATAAAHGDGGLVFRTPMSGRFYRKPAPDKPFFVEVGQIIETGHTVALLEVMKTFNRVRYGGEGLPKRAKVVRIIPSDGADLEAEDGLIEVESAD